MRYLCIFFLLVSGMAMGQLQPNGQFMKDTVKIGEPIAYSLSLKYPRGLDVVFPDSLYDFSPYELTNKEYFPTRSNDSVSYDSAVYYLMTFEIDTVQTLALPVFILSSSDSTPVYATTDTVILQQLVKEIPDSVNAEAAPLIENTSYINVETQFNYPYLIIGVAILLAALTVVYILFGKSIRRYFRARKLTKDYYQFDGRYSQLLSREATQKNAEKLLLTWKRYLEKLESHPFTKFTTKEILKLSETQPIENELKDIDRLIYGPSGAFKAEDSFIKIKEFAHNRFERKLEEVKNA